MKDPYKRNYKNKNAQKERELTRIGNSAMYPCSYKKKYNKMPMAKRAAHKESMKAMVELYAYKCPWCKFFHLTSSAPRL